MNNVRTCYWNVNLYAGNLFVSCSIKQNNIMVFLIGSQISCMPATQHQLIISNNCLIKISQICTTHHNWCEPIIDGVPISSCIVGVPTNDLNSVKISQLTTKIKDSTKTRLTCSRHMIIFSNIRAAYFMISNVLASDFYVMRRIKGNDVVVLPAL